MQCNDKLLYAIYREEQVENKRVNNLLNSARRESVGVILGRVDGFDQDEGAGESDERGEVRSCFLAA